MMPYILHVAVLITLVVIFYKWVLEKETHYRWNRWVLLGAMGLAFVLPTFLVPAEYSVSTLWEAPKVEEKAAPMLDVGFSYKPDFQAFPEEEAARATEPQATSLNAAEMAATEATPAISFWQVAKDYTPQALLALYLFGVAFFALRLLRQMASLFRQIRLLPRTREGKYILLEPTDEKASYSFFRYIFINSAPLDLSTFRQILSHEKIHADQWHSLDILLAELLLIVQWFNPFAWAYRKALRQNLEYLTDDLMVQRGTDLTAYQMSLLQVAAPKYAYSLVANYNQSLLKKRILMMQTKKSSLLAGWKYFFLITLLALSIPLFNAKAIVPALTAFPVVDMETSPILLAQNEAPVTEQLTQSDDLIASENLPETSTSTPFPPQLLTSQSITGTWEGIQKEGEMCLRVIRSLSENDWNWISHRCYSLDEFSPQNFMRESTFTLKKEAGELVMSGTFLGNKGEGTFEFLESATYRQQLTRKGVKEISEELMFRLFFVDDQEAYIQNMVALSALDLPPQTLRTLLPEGIKAKLVKAYLDEGFAVEDHLNFVRSHVNPELLSKYRAAGLDFEAHKNFIHSHVNPELLTKYKAAGFDLEANKNFIHSHVSPELLSKYRDAGFDLEKHKNFIHSHVSPELLSKYRDAGFDLAENKNFIHSHVSPELLKKYQSAGFDFEKHKNFIHSHVSPELLAKYRDAGFNFEETKNFIHSHVSPELLGKYKAAGFDFEQHKNFIHSHVSPDLLSKYRDAGFDFEKTKKFIHSHVSPDLLKKYKAAGFDFEKHKNFIHSHVNPELLTKYKAAGFDFESHKNFIHSHVNPELLSEYKALGLDFEKHKSYIHSHMNPEFLKGYLDAGYSLEKYKKFVHSYISADFLKSYEKAGLDIDKHQEFILDRVPPEKVKKYREKLRER